MVRSSLHRTDSSGNGRLGGRAPCRQPEPTPVFLGNSSSVSLVLSGHKASSLRSGRGCPGRVTEGLWQPREQPYHEHRLGGWCRTAVWRRTLPVHTATIWPRAVHPLHMPPQGSHPESWVPGSLHELQSAKPWSRKKNSYPAFIPPNL